MGIRLSDRLSAVAAMVTEGNRVADVGTDHGWVPVYLVSQGRVPSAIAMDVRPGPLSRAREHILLHGLKDRIETRLSDGLEALAQGEADTLILAGMGGLLMEKILRKDFAVAASFREWILQPQSDVPHLRRMLAAGGWVPDREDMVLEDGKYYTMMHIPVPPAAGDRPPEELFPEILPGAWTREELFGSCLLRERHPVLGTYLEHERRVHEKMLANISRSTTGAGTARLREAEEEKRKIEDALELFAGLG